MKAKDKNSSQADVHFGECTSVNSKMLMLMGLIVRVENNKRDRRSQIIERLATLMMNFLCVIIAIFQIQWIVDLWNVDKNLMMQIMTSGISNIVCICKGYRLAYCREDIQTIFEKLAIVWDQTRLPTKIREEIITGAQNTLFFCKCYVYMMIALGICFGLPPLKNFLLQYLAREATNHTYDYSKRVFLVRYPFEINSSSIYFAVLLEEQYVLFCSALYWVCCDTLFAQLTTHTSLQFEILRYDIENGVDCRANDERTRDDVVDHIKRHLGLLKLCEMIEKIFSPVIFTTMLLTSINICVNMIELRQMVGEARIGDAILHGFHLANIFFQLLVYCIFAERLTQQTGSIANASYNCKWTEKNHKLRLYFRVLIMKSQKPFYCTAYGIFPIGHNRIIQIVNRAMSFYMMLQTTS